MKTKEALIQELCQQKKETPWLEFKKDNYRPDMIGEDISALANSATLCDHDVAYMIWGIDNATHEIVGTQYDLQTLKKGNEEMESWLRRLLSPNADFQSDTIDINGKHICILTIHKAVNFPNKLFYLPLFGEFSLERAYFPTKASYSYLPLFGKIKQENTAAGGPGNF